MDQWRAHYTQPAAAQTLLRSIRYSESMLLNTISVCLRYFGDREACGRLDIREDVICLHIGVARVPERVPHPDLEDWAYHTFRLLGSPARIKMLRAMLKKPITTREMAQQLQIHLGTVGRDVSSMYDARLLIVEPINGRSFYRTNTEALELLARQLQSLPMLDQQDN